MISAFATLEAAWPWAAGVVAILTALYLLEPRRRQLQVPFGALWQTVLRQVEARRLGRRWRRLASWLAMVTIAMALLAALAERPLGIHLWRAMPPTPLRHTVVIVDVSASMATLDGALGAALLPRSRLDEARDRLDELYAAARPGERFLLMSAAAGVRTQAPWSAETAPLRAAVARLQPSDAGFDLERALRAAADALHGRGQPEVIVVTDGGTGADGALPQRAEAGGVAVRWLLVGPAAHVAEDGKAAARPALDNLAVVRVGVRNTRDDPSRGVVNARVRNDAAVSVAARVVLASRAEGRAAADFAAAAAVVAEQTLTLPPRAEAEVRFDAIDLVGARFAVQVRPADPSAAADVAPQDDWGFAVAAQRRRLGVLWVGGDNLFLEAALVANDRFEVRRIAADAYQPAAFAAERRLAHGIDVAILDQVPKASPPGLPTLRFDLRPHADALGTDPRALARGAEAPDAAVPTSPPADDAATLARLGVRPPLELAIADAHHPLMRGLSLQDANVDLVRPLQPPPGAAALITDRDRSAIVVAQDAGIRRVDAGLDLIETDLGGRYLLPLFIAAAIDWLAVDDEPVVSALELGRPWAIGAAVRGVAWTWQEPGRPPVPARTSGDAILAISERAGIHVFRSDAGLELTRPTVAPPSERPDRWAAPTPRWRAGAATAAGARPQAPLTAWALLALLAAAALVIEWGLFQRRRTV